MSFFPRFVTSSTSSISSSFPTSSSTSSSFLLQSIRHATKKAGGSTKNGRDSPGQRLGVKKFGGEVVIPGNIIIRQRGQKYHCGVNTKMGRDHTIYSITTGYVKFQYNSKLKRQFVNVQDENPNPPPYTKKESKLKTLIFN